MPKKSSSSADAAAEATSSPPQTELLPATTSVIAAPKSRSQKAVQELMQDIVREHQAFRETMTSGVGHAIAAGGALLAARPLVGHGEFLNWVKDNFESQYGLTERTAQRYMQVAENEPEIRAILRGEFPTCVSDLTADDLLAEVSINQALRIVAQIKRQRRTGSPNPKHRGPLPQAPWKASRTPQLVAERALRFLGEIDYFLSVVNEESFVSGARSACGPTVLREPGELRGRVFTNAVTRADVTLLVSHIQTAQQQQTVLEACVLLSTMADVAWSRSTAASPRMVFSVRHTVPVLVDGNFVEMRLPTPVLLLYFGPAERVAAFHECFADSGTTFVSWPVGDIRSLRSLD